jgi:oligopeptide/dipeptide ABC transporter ATP-binding protein
MIFQDPMTSLNPSYRISKQMVEPLVWHNLMQGKQAEDHAIKQLEHVGIPEARKRFSDYPYQFSGGMRQRVMIAMSLTCSPKLLIADEPTTALDVTVRSQILNLLQDMKAELGMSVIIITHDFGIATNFCDRIIVLYAGKIVETAPTSVFVSGSKHPYSQGLLNSTLEVSTDRKIKPIQGNPPNMLAVPPGCSFHPRCEYAMPRCKTDIPPLLTVAKDHCVACHLVKGGGPCE